MPYNNYRQDLMGEATLTPSGQFEIGTYQSFKLIYTAGKFGIDDQGGLRIGFRGHFDGSAIQFSDPTAPGYTTVEASNGAVLEMSWEARRNIRPWNKSLYIRCLRFLREGDQIVINFGDQSKGSPKISLNCQPRQTQPFQWCRAIRQIGRRFCQHCGGRVRHFDCQSKATTAGAIHQTVLLER